MILFILAAGGFWLNAMARISQDKSLNSEVDVLWSYGKAVPLGTVVPPHNRWIDHAFVAERSHEGASYPSVLILDDHYRGTDRTYRLTESGIVLVGGAISPRLLCSLPSQAENKQVTLDPVVLRLVRSKCGHVR